MYIVCLDSLITILGHHYATILLAKMLIWAPFSQSMCAFYFCINPCLLSLIVMLIDLQCWFSLLR